MTMQEEMRLIAFRAIQCYLRAADSITHGPRCAVRNYSKIVAVFTGVSIRSTLPHLAHFQVGGFSWLWNSTFSPGWQVFAGIFPLTSTLPPKFFVTLFLDLISS